MGLVKLNLSLQQEVAALLRLRAEQEGLPVSRYLADLVRADEKRRLDALAEEGYRQLSQETQNFSADASPLSAEVWSTWEEP